MKSFCNAWIEKNIDNILKLFSNNVEYWETPTDMIGDKNRLRVLWEEILPLENQEINYNIIETDQINNKYIIEWHFTCKGESSSGRYFITLNNENLCTYFLQTFQ